MKRSLGALVFLVVLGAPILIAPAMVWQSPAPAPEAQRELADGARAYGFFYDADSEVRGAVAAPSQALLTLSQDSSTQSVTFSSAPTMVRTRFVIRADEAVFSAQDAAPEPAMIAVRALAQEDPEPSRPIPFHAIVLLEAQRTLVAVGVSAHPHLSGAYAASTLLAQPPTESFARSVVTNTLEPGMVPGWMLHATWVLLLVAIGLTLRPALLAGLVGLFSRFNQSDVLEHERRGRLFAAIQADPGASLVELCERTALATGVGQHHLRLLEQHELVRRVRDGRATRFYPRGPRFAPPALRSATRQRLVELVRTDPTLDATNIADRLGQRPQSTWHHIRILEAAGVLTATKEGRSMRWRAAAF